MWLKIKLIKNYRKYNIYRYKCSICSKEVDASKQPKKCSHNFGYNIDSIWLEILRSALGIKNGRSKLEINITKKYIIKLLEKQNNKCCISGIPIYLGINASLDRKDSSIGYTKNNVQWVHKDINILKGNFSEVYLKEMCKNVEIYNRSSK